MLPEEGFEGEDGGGVEAAGWYEDPVSFVENTIVKWQLAVGCVCTRTKKTGMANGLRQVLEEQPEKFVTKGADGRLGGETARRTDLAPK